MRTKLLIAFVGLCLLSSEAFTQTFRYADLSIDFTSPKSGAVFNSPTTIKYDFKVFNLGPDTLFPTDTLIFSTGHSFEYRPPETKMSIEKTIAPGDSFSVSNSVSVNSEQTTNEFNLFFVRVPMAYGPDNGKLKLVNEFTEDRENNRSSVKLKHVGNASSNTIQVSTINIYPNPTTSHSVTVVHPTSCSTVKLFNGSGQLLSSVPVTGNVNTTTLNLPTLPFGIYIVQVEYDEGILTKKLVIE